MKILAVPTNRAFKGAAQRRCPLCRCNLSISVDSLVGETSCPNCGLNVKQLEAARPEPTPLRPAAAKELKDPLDRWLSGDSLQPKRQSDWEHVSDWIRKHPRISGGVAATLVGLVAATVGLYYAYTSTAESLQLATVACTAAERERLELSEAVSRNEAELKLHQDRLQSQLKEHEWLKTQFRELQANYQQTQQQVRIAENLLQGTFRGAPAAKAEAVSSAPTAETTAAIPTSVAAPFQMPAAVNNSMPAPSVKPVPVVHPTLPSASLAPPPVIEAAPAATNAAPIQEVTVSPPAAIAAPVQMAEAAPPAVSALPVDETQSRSLEATTESNHVEPAQAFQQTLTAATTAPPAEMVQVHPSEANLVPVHDIQHVTTQSSIVLIREVPASEMPSESFDPIHLPPAQPQAPAAPVVQQLPAQDIVVPMTEVQTRGHNGPVSLKKRKSELFRLD